LSLNLYRSKSIQFPVKQKLQKQQIQNNKIIRPTLQSSNYIKLINTTKSSIYLLSRSDKIKTIFLAFQNSKLKDDVRIDEIFKHFLSNNSQTSSNLKYNAKSLNLNKIAPTNLYRSKSKHVLIYTGLNLYTSKSLQV